MQDICAAIDVGAVRSFVATDVRGVRRRWLPVTLQGRDVLLAGKAVWLRYDHVRGRVEGELPAGVCLFVAQRFI